VALCWIAGTLLIANSYADAVAMAALVFWQQWPDKRQTASPARADVLVNTASGGGYRRRDVPMGSPEWGAWIPNNGRTSILP